MDELSLSVRKGGSFVGGNGGVLLGIGVVVKRLDT